MDNRNNIKDQQQQTEDLFSLLRRRGASLFPEEDHVERRQRLVETMNLETSASSTPTSSTPPTNRPPFDGGLRRVVRRRHSAPPSTMMIELENADEQRLFERRRLENLRLLLGEALILVDSFEMSSDFVVNSSNQSQEDPRDEIDNNDDDSIDDDQQDNDDEGH